MFYKNVRINNSYMLYDVSIEDIVSYMLLNELNIHSIILDGYEDTLLLKQLQDIIEHVNRYVCIAIGTIQCILEIEQFDIVKEELEKLKTFNFFELKKYIENRSINNKYTTQKKLKELLYNNDASFNLKLVDDIDVTIDFGCCYDL